MMAKLLLLILALLINLGLFTLMYYLVADNQTIPPSVLPVLQLQYVDLLHKTPVEENVESPPTLPKLPSAYPIPPIMSSPLPVVSELPESPEIKLPTLAQTLPELDLATPTYFGEMTPPMPPSKPISNLAKAEQPAAATHQSVTPHAHQTASKKPRIVQADRNLLPLLKTKPQYPRLARRRGIEGKVEIKFLINTQGAVEKEKVVLSDPEGVFDEAALQAVRRWKFAPRYIDGKPVYQRAQQVIEFKLR